MEQKLYWDGREGKEGRKKRRRQRALCIQGALRGIIKNKLIKPLLIIHGPRGEQMLGQNFAWGRRRETRSQRKELKEELQNYIYSHEEKKIKGEGESKLL